MVRYRVSLPSPEFGPHPLPRKRVCLPETWVLGGSQTHLRIGVGRPNSDEGTQTLVLYVYFKPSTILPNYFSQKCVILTQENRIRNNAVSESASLMGGKS
jgi:hypothetical protein